MFASRLTCLQTSRWWYRHTFKANATITVNFASMLNTTAGASFIVRDVWQGKDVGTATGSYTSTVMPQAVTYLILTPANSSAH